MGLLERGTEGPTFIPALCDRYFSHRENAETHTEYRITNGVMNHYVELSAGFDYLAGHAVAEDMHALPGLSIWQIPAQTYAELPCTMPGIGEASSFFSRAGYPHLVISTVMLCLNLNTIPGISGTWRKAPSICRSRS